MFELLAILLGSGSRSESAVGLAKRILNYAQNNLTELVRDIRSQFGYIKGEFRTFALDVGSTEYDAFIHSDGSYDFVLNLSNYQILN